MVIRNVVFDGKITLLSPLSHIKERVEEAPGKSVALMNYYTVIATDDAGKRYPVNVPCYSGNAWRGLLRRSMGENMLALAERKTTDIPEARFLLQGGSSLEKKQKDKKGKKDEGNGDEAGKSAGGLNIRRLREIAKRNILAGLLGGTLPDIMLPGKLRVGIFYPVCAETTSSGLIPAWLHGNAAWPQAAALLFRATYYRNDIAKDPIAMSFVAENVAVAEKKAEEAADQMLMTGEFLAAGTVLYSHIAAPGATDAELGLLIRGLADFSQNPHIGGQSAKGHGLVKMEYRVSDNGKRVGTINIGPDGFTAEGDVFSAWTGAAEKAIKAMKPEDFFPKD